MNLFLTLQKDIKKEYKKNREQEKKGSNNINNINNNININNYEDYIILTNVNIEEKKDDDYIKYFNTDKKIKNTAIKKKFVNILEYQKTNIFTEGDNFGAIGVSSKKGKRTATCICSENCHLGFLTKNEYNEFLEKITEKISNKLYDLIMKNNIFENMIKSKFLTKYAHMFRFMQYNKNSMIINEKEEINKLIILYEGEFSLSVNLNLIELNDTIIQYTKIKNKLNNNTKNDSKIQEIEENKKLIIKMKDYTKDIIDIITEKNNFILSNVAYIIEKEMLKLIDKENNYIRNTPEIITSKIELILKRLNELKVLVIKKIKDKQLFKTSKIIINKNNIITRNLEPKKIKNLSTLVDFNQKYLSKDIAKNNNLILSQMDFNNNKLYSSEDKLKNNISKKEILLNNAQCRSQKYLLFQKTELKHYKRKANAIKNKDNYKDLALIFSSRTNNDKTFLDKLKEKLEKESISENQNEQFNKNKKKDKKINLKLISKKDLYKTNNVYTLNNINTTNTFNSLYNKFREGIKTENKFNINDINDTFTSFYTNNKTLFNLNNKLILNTSGKNINTINLNDRKINCYNNNYQDSYNELYLNYIMDKIQNDKNNINIDAYQYKNLSTTPNKYLLPSIAIFSPEKLKKKENIKKFKNISISKFRNIGV